jgi:hypothetical protein
MCSDDRYYIVDISREVISWRAAVENVYEFSITKPDDAEIVAEEESHWGELLSTITLDRRTLRMTSKANHLTPPESVDLQCYIAPDQKL